MAFEFTRQRKILYGVIAVLAVVLAALVVYTQVFGETPLPLERPSSSLGGLKSEEASKPFDASILTDERYTTLNRTLLEAGRLPVPPPSVRGRVNLFGP